MSDKPDILRIELTPSHVVDEDTIDPAKLGPTVAQLVEMHQQGTLQPRDLAGHLAIVAAFIARGEVPPPEYVGENPEPIAPEVRAMLGEHLVRKAGWEHAKKVNGEYADEVQARDAELRRLANDQFPDLSVDAGDIADTFLALADSDPMMADVLSVRAKGGAKRRIDREWLRKILARGRK
jgi:hypothetical protein